MTLCATPVRLIGLLVWIRMSDSGERDLDVDRSGESSSNTSCVIGGDVILAIFVGEESSTSGESGISSPSFLPRWNILYKSAFSMGFERDAAATYRFRRALNWF